MNEGSDEPLHTSDGNALHNSNDSVGSYPVDDTEMNIDELLSLGSSSFDMRLTNPVQMELQENARLPTFYGTVDRSGSSSIGISRRVPEAALHSPSRQQQQQRQHSDSGDDINWGELFLNDRHRVSYHGNYKEAGILKETLDTFPFPGMSMPTEIMAAPADFDHHSSNNDDTNDSNNHSDSNDFLIQVDPTPLSEIKRRVEEIHHRQREHHATITTTGNEGSRHHPYSRSTPLAYDQFSSNHNTTDTVNMANAIATAAALASTTHRPTSTGMSKLPPASAGVLLDLSTKKKNYGFGPNHVVPSVPESNTRRRSRKRPPPVITTTNNDNNTFVPMSPPYVSGTGSTHHHDHTMEDPDADRGSPTNPGDAYERKKQRAKDARVKLNDSIDRMHISIRLALTQSQQRLQQTQQAMTPAQKEKIGPLLQQTIRIAETAKKWDRPSFVGSAAALIQMLNAQCEALMVMVMKSPCDDDENANANTGRNMGNAQKSTATAAISPSQNGHKRHVMDDSNHSDSQNGFGGGIEDYSNSKRIRSTPTNEHQATTEIKDDGTWMTNGRILECIASYLDPPSLLRSHFRICKAWTALGIFDSDPAWERLVLQRFGHYCVRQWRDKLHLDDTSGYPSFQHLYKSMDTANAMPHIASVHQNEGWFLLGETRLPGTISAWVYLIERSNGETLRSVHQASTNKFQSLPIVELRTVLQNTGGKDIVWKMDQMQSVDTSTRRRAEEMKELQGDDGRFAKRVLRLVDGTLHPMVSTNTSNIRLQLFESVIVVSYIHAVHCNTISKFVQKSNFTRWLVQVNGTTVPLVIPFPRDALGLQH